MNTLEATKHRLVSIQSLTYLVIALLLLALLKLPYGLLVDQLTDYQPASGSITFLKSDKNFTEVLSDVSKFETVRETPNFGYGEATYWLRLNLEGIDSSQSHMLEIAFPILNRVTMFYRSDGAWQTYEAGIDIPHNKWSVVDRNIVFPLAMGTQQVFLKVETSHTLIVPMEIIPADDFHKHEMIDSLIWGSFYGLVFIMFIYNGLLYLSTRQESYLYYVGYVMSTTLFVSSLNGIGYQYIWPMLPSFNADSGTIFPCFMMLFSIQFTLLFLGIPDKFPRIHRYLSTIQVLNAALLIAAIFLPVDLNLLTSILVDISVISIFVTGLYCLYKGHSAAKYFVVAWSAFLIGLGIYAFTVLGFLPSNNFTMHAKETGFIFEIMLLSFALADRIRTLTEETIYANKSRELALKMANRALNDNVKTKDEFLATISHELRTPMNGFIGSLEIMSDYVLPKNQRETVSLAYRSALDMYSMIESILDFSELQNNSLKIKKFDFDLQNSIRALEQRYQQIADNKGIEFNLNLDESLPQFASGDGTRLLQVINQLIENALKFTLRGKVSVAAIANSLSDSETDFCAQIVVTDTGIGISEDKKDRVFLPFTQSDGSHARKFSGLGLGLPLSKELAQKMGGSITYVPNEVGGSIFTASIPLKTAKSGGTVTIDTNKKLDINQDIRTGINFEPQPCKEASLDDALKTILIVEDNQTNMLIASAYCKKLGFKVLHAENGKVAVDLLSSNTVVAIIMDCQMPIMDGYEATKAIRALNNSNASLPIIAVTANTSSKDCQRCMDAGMNDYLAKPMTKAMLAKKLDYWI